MIAISFDFDGVLANSPFAHGVLFPVLDGLAADYAEIERFEPDDAERIVRDTVWRHFRRRLDEERYVEAYDWQAVVVEAAEELGLEFSGSLPELTREFAVRLAQESDPSLRFPGAVEVLAELAARDTCLIMLTNGFRDYQWPTADALGLATHFSHFFASDDLRSVKPFPEAFERAFASCPEADGARLHVGDSLTQDVAGANGNGIASVWVHRNLPPVLAEKSPAERAHHAAIEDVIRAKLEKEDQSAVHFDYDDCRPDAVISSLDEMIWVYEWYRAKRRSVERR